MCVIAACEGHPVTKLALEFTHHVFVRPGELRHAEWDEFDFDKRIWTRLQLATREFVMGEGPPRSNVTVITHSNSHFSVLSQFLTNTANKVDIHPLAPLICFLSYTHLQPHIHDSVSGTNYQTVAVRSPLTSISRDSVFATSACSGLAACAIASAASFMAAKMSWASVSGDPLMMTA